MRALCDGRVADGKLFFVGDYKQSIYRFRGADPHVFRRLRDEIPAARPLAADAELPQPAGRARVRQRPVLPTKWARVRAAGPHRPQLGPTPAVEFLWAIEPEEEAAARPRRRR